jgi:hypothetical protein
MKQAWPQMTPVQAKDILKTTARDVTKGRASPSTRHHRAGPGADLATGYGIADATKADAASEVAGGRGPDLPARRGSSGADRRRGGMEELVLSLALPEGEEM